MGLSQPLHVTIPRGQYEQLDASMTIENRIIAPVSHGQVLGTVSVRLGDSDVSETPLVALQDVGEGSIWQRVIDEALLYFE